MVKKLNLKKLLVIALLACLLAATTVWRFDLHNQPGYALPFGWHKGSLTAAAISCGTLPAVFPIPESHSPVTGFPFLTERNDGSACNAYPERNNSAKILNIVAYSIGYLLAATILVEAFSLVRKRIASDD